MIVFRTDRLLLRHFHILDTEAMIRVFGDAEVMRYGPGPQTVEWVQGRLKTCLLSYQAWGFGPWAVVEKRRHITVGYCGLFYFPDIAGQPEIEIGYRLARSFWARGYATEAVRATRDYAFHVLGTARLIAMIDPQNASSIHVAEKAGMRYEKEVMLPGYTHPDCIYALANPIRTTAML